MSGTLPDPDDTGLPTEQFYPLAALLGELPDSLPVPILPDPPDPPPSMVAVPTRAQRPVTLAELFAELDQYDNPALPQPRVPSPRRDPLFHDHAELDHPDAAINSAAINSAAVAAEDVVRYQVFLQRVLDGLRRL